MWVSKKFICTQCSSPPVVADAEDESSYDYIWTCSRNRCKNNLKPSYTYDTEQPKWVKYIG